MASSPSIHRHGRGNLLLIAMVANLSTIVTSQTNQMTLVNCSSAPSPAPSSSTSSSSFSNSTFWSNVVALLDALPSAAAPTGFASLSQGNGTDRAYVRGLCRGDTTPAHCATYLQNAALAIRQSSCNSSRRAGIWYDDGSGGSVPAPMFAFVSYADTNASTAYEDAYQQPFKNAILVPDQETFEGVYTALMRNLTARVVNGGSGTSSSPAPMFATGAAVYDPGAPNGTMYGLMQCMRDRTLEECQQCLNASVQSLTSCCRGYRGGMVFRYNCYMRMEVYPYYNLTLDGPSLDGGNGGKKRVHVALAVALPIGTVLLAAVVIFCFFLYMRKINGKIKTPLDDEDANGLPDLNQGVQDEVAGGTNEGRQDGHAGGAVLGEDEEQHVLHHCDLNNDAAEEQDELLPGIGTLASELQALKLVLIDTSATPTKISYAAIQDITKNFSKEIGRGGFGVVYLGTLQNDWNVAVKKLNPARDLDDKKFLEEVTCLLKVKHTNIARFLGYCVNSQGEVLSYDGKYVVAEERQRFLCFEYIPNGSLDRHIKEIYHGGDCTICYQVITGICQGLQYLHKQNINHLDLKPENVLLDANMQPKITDFGLSRCFDYKQSRIFTDHRSGTPRYMAPELNEKGEISFKTDIYSLGMIMMELMLGRNNKNSTTNGDGSLLDGNCPQMKKCVEIAQRCVSADQHKRPFINEIINELNEIQIAKVPPVTNKSRNVPIYSS